MLTFKHHQLRWYVVAFNLDAAFRCTSLVSSSVQAMQIGRWRERATQTQTTKKKILSLNSHKIHRIDYSARPLRIGWDYEMLVNCNDHYDDLNISS